MQVRLHYAINCSVDDDQGHQAADQIAEQGTPRFLLDLVGRTTNQAVGVASGLRRQQAAPHFVVHADDADLLAHSYPRLFHSGNAQGEFILDVVARDIFAVDIAFISLVYCILRVVLAGVARQLLPSFRVPTLLGKDLVQLSFAQFDVLLHQPVLVGPDVSKDGKHRHQLQASTVLKRCGRQKISGVADRRIAVTDSFVETFEDRKAQQAHVS